MKILYLLGLLFICSCSQKKSDSINPLKDQIPPILTLKSSSNIFIKNDIVYFKDQKYSGYLYTMHTNNIDTFSIEGYLNGLQSGLTKKWFTHKRPMEIRLYKNGSKNGKQLAFWENGNKKFEFIAKNDAYEGEMKEWSEDGKLIHLSNYKDGQENGAQKLWYDNGKIKANYVIVQGKRYGLLGTKNCKNVSDSIFIVK
jgi:antitoxin component YwqK of YwqJK toxin-antitoxin module